MYILLMQRFIQNKQILEKKNFKIEYYFGNRKMIDFKLITFESPLQNNYTPRLYVNG